MNAFITGLFFVFGFLFASFFLWRQARSLGLEEEKVIDLSLIVVFWGIIGGRVGYAIDHWSIFQPSFSRLLLFLKYPGISVLGFMLTAIVIALILARKFKFGVWEILDLFSLPSLIFLLIALSSCRVSPCLNLNQPAILPVEMFLLVVIIVLRQIKHVLINLPKVKNRGFIFFLTILVGLGVGLLLAKNLPRPLYLALETLTLLDVFWIGFSYREIFKMIKFPKSLLAPIQEYLEQRRRETEKRLVQLKKDDPNSDKGRLHQEFSDDDTATDKAKHENVAAIQNQLNRTLIETRKALSKIKLGSYGICENCKTMIDTDRLTAMPSATLCMDCERKREKSAK